MAFKFYLPGEIRPYPPTAPQSTRTIKVIDRWIMRYPSKRNPNGTFYTRYLYEDLMDRLVEDCHANVANEYDNVIVVQGKEGSGKSSFAIRLAKAINPDFDLETDYIYSYDEMVAAVTGPDNDDIGRVFWLDETSSIMNNRDAMTSSSKNMVELLEMMRSRGWTLIMCIPSVERLDKYLRDHRIRYLITVEEMAWDYKYTEKSRGFWKLEFKWGDSYETFNTVGFGKFDPMTEDEKVQYKAIKLKSQQTKMAEIAGRDKEKNKYDRAQDKMCDAMLMLYESGVSKDELADRFGYSIQSITPLLSKARKQRRDRGEA